MTKRLDNFAQKIEKSEHKNDKNENFKKWLGLLVLSLALAIILIDTTFLNVAIPVLIKDLNTNLESIQWVVSAYSLVIAALTITGGRLGDIFGRKKIFILGATLFAAGSFIASIAPNVGILILGEAIIEGVGAALMLPATLSLLLSTFVGKERNIAFGIWGSVAGASSAIGPLLGGFLIDLNPSDQTWRWGFRINVVIAIILVLGTKFIKESYDKTKGAKIDILGILLSGFGLASLVFGIIEGGRYGWIQPTKAFDVFGMNLNAGPISVVLISFILSAILLIAFVLWEIKREKSDSQPIVSMRLFLNKGFSLGLLITAILALGQLGLIFALPIFFQSVLSLTAFQIGVALLPMSIGVFITGPIAGILSNKIKPKLLIIAGILLTILGSIFTYFVISEKASVWDFVIGLFIYGAGISLTMSQLTNVVLSNVSLNKSGEASGVNNTIRQVGSSLGSAIIGSVIATIFITTFNSNLASVPLPPAASAQISDIVKSSDVGFAIGLGDKKSKNTLTQEEAQLKSITDKSVAESLKQAVLVAIGFVLFGLVAAAFLPSKRAEAIDKEDALASH